MFNLHCSSELFCRTFYYVFTFLRCGFLHFQIDFQRIFTLTNINLNMVFHRIQYENMSKEEFIQELTDINSRFVNDINTEQSFRKNLMNSCQNMIRFLQNFSNIKSLTPIYWQGSYSWNATLWLIRNIAEERRKLFFCQSLNFLNIMLKIRLIFS